jgi:hypothetical protein
VHSCNPIYLGSRGRKIMNLRSARAKVSETLSQNKMAQVVEGLPSMHEALSPNK